MVHHGDIFEMKYNSLAAIFPLVVSAIVYAAPPRVFQSDGETLMRTRQAWETHDAAVSKAVQKLERRANQYLDDGPYSVVDKKHPIPGIDKHEYVSLAPYFWPNPRTPDGLPYIRKDGVRNPDINKYDVVPLSQMSQRAYTLALAGYITRERKYSDRAALLLRTFFLEPATKMNPDFEHAQFVMGENRGRHAGLIESRRLLHVVDAVGLLEASNSSWTREDGKQIRDWFRQFTDWMQNGDMKDEGDAKNNHGTWYDVQVVTFRLFLGDTAEARRILEEAKTNRIARQIEPTGEEPEEIVRTKSLSYSAFNLLALTDLADLGRQANVDLWHYKTADGRCIRAVIDNLIPYATGQKKWPHQQIARFDPSELLTPLARAAVAYHDPTYTAVREKIRGRAANPDESIPGAQF